MSRYAVKTRADSPELRKAAIAIEASAWNSLGFLNFTRSHFQHYDELLERYADYQICLVDTETGYPVAVGVCVPFACAGPDQLRPEGWDWIVESASRRDVAPNMLGGLGISVPQIHRSKGLARQVIKAMHQIAEDRKLNGVVIPVRPTAKAKHPHVPMSEYIEWKDEAGRAYDPWLRSHLAAGGKVVGTAPRSMVVEEPVAFWETWSGKQFPDSGEYALPGALTPVSIKLEDDVGRYEEPNVWFAYAA
ncbi:MAG: transferase [Hyphomonadaceae bacterium]